MDFGLQGKRALVTGGSLGIGKAIALELAREGVDVAIVARTKDRLEAAARELEGQTGRRVIPLVADVTSKEQVDRAVAQAAETDPKQTLRVFFTAFTSQRRFRRSEAVSPDATVSARSRLETAARYLRPHPLLQPTREIGQRSHFGEPTKPA